MDNIGILRTDIITLSHYLGHGMYKYKIIIYNNGNFTIDLLPGGGSCIKYMRIKSQIINLYPKIISIMFNHR